MTLSIYAVESVYYALHICFSLWVLIPHSYQPTYFTVQCETLHTHQTEIKIHHCPNYRLAVLFLMVCYFFLFVRSLYAQCGFNRPDEENQYNRRMGCLPYALTDRNHFKYSSWVTRSFYGVMSFVVFAYALTNDLQKKNYYCEPVIEKQLNSCTDSAFSSTGQHIYVFIWMLYSAVIPPFVYTLYECYKCRYASNSHSVNNENNRGENYRTF